MRLRIELQKKGCGSRSATCLPTNQKLPRPVLSFLLARPLVYRHLTQPGVFAGNDSIVAFARLHNLTVVIHQVGPTAPYLLRVRRWNS
jgi:hypothetical protein